MSRFSDWTSVSIPAGRDSIQGDLTLPYDAGATVIFAHGSGSSRYSTRNRFVAKVLNDGGLATLLIDLLTSREELVDVQTAEYRFDIELLATRLMAATGWTSEHPILSTLPTGYFGASTGAAAALFAAAHRPDSVEAIVSRGGRPDLAGDALRQVAAPTLLIVGELDREVIKLNRQAAREMQAPSEIQIIPGATHLFEEKGAMEKVAALACDWFQQKMIRKSAA